MTTTLKQREQAYKWRHAHPEQANSINRANNKMRRNKALEYYGGKCVCCGETNPGFLTFDHINNDGASHRKKIGHHLASWLYSQNFPSDFQILCYNCNCGRATNKGVCPHKEAICL